MISKNAFNQYFFVNVLEMYKFKNIK